MDLPMRGKEPSLKTYIKLQFHTAYVFRRYTVFTIDKAFLLNMSETDL